MKIRDQTLDQRHGGIVSFFEAKQDLEGSGISRLHETQKILPRFLVEPADRLDDRDRGQLDGRAECFFPSAQTVPDPYVGEQGVEEEKKQDEKDECLHPDHERPFFSLVRF